MNQQINIQVHDYDRIGRYLIVEDRKASREEVLDMRKRARKSVRVDWESLDPKLTHIVYYAELVDEKDNVFFASFYMHGEAYDDNDFYRIFTRPGVGYVGAIHKRI